MNTKAIIGIFSIIFVTLMLTMVVFAIGTRKLFPGPRITVPVGSSVKIMSADHYDKHRIFRVWGPYDVALGTAPVTCTPGDPPTTNGFPVKKGEIFSFPADATYSAYATSCGASDSYIFKLRDQ